MQVVNFSPSLPVMLDGRALSPMEGRKLSSDSGPWTFSVNGANYQVALQAPKGDSSLMNVAVTGGAGGGVQLPLAAALMMGADKTPLLAVYDPKTVATGMQSSTVGYGIALSFQMPGQSAAWPSILMASSTFPMLGKVVASSMGSLDSSDFAQEGFVPVCVAVGGQLTTPVRGGAQVITATHPTATTWRLADASAEQPALMGASLAAVDGGLAGAPSAAPSRHMVVTCKKMKQNGMIVGYVLGTVLIAMAIAALVVIHRTKTVQNNSPAYKYAMAFSAIALAVGVALWVLGAVAAGKSGYEVSAYKTWTLDKNAVY